MTLLAIAGINFLIKKYAPHNHNDATSPASEMIGLMPSGHKTA